MELDTGTSVAARVLDVSEKVRSGTSVEPVSNQCSHVSPHTRGPTASAIPVCAVAFSERQSSKRDVSCGLKVMHIITALEGCAAPTLRTVSYKDPCTRLAHCS